MADTAIIDIDAEDAPKDSKTNDHDRSRKKRKKNVPEHLRAQEKEARIEALQKELDALFGYYKEVENQKVGVGLSECGSRNAVIAVLMEDSEFPLSMLVEEIYDELKNAGSGVVQLVERVTHASVKSNVLSVEQKLVYGVPNADADMLEDHSETCLWCWEKLLRGQFVVWRICQRRIHEGIMAVSEMISSLKKPESEQNYNHGLIKALAKLGKAYSEAEIRLSVDGLLQKNSVDMTQKKAKQEEKLLLKQLNKNRREVENGDKCMHNELQRETLVNEKHLKLLQGESSKDDKCYEKDICKKRKQKKEETEKDWRRREKEESELQKKRSLQKQVSIMEHFLKRSKTCHSFQRGGYYSDLFSGHK